MRKSGDPFETETFPKAFYYPTQQKDLTERERKICLSPGHKKEDQNQNPADEKFLQHTNHMKIHEVPTRENGTIEDHSSSSKFDESWPSTERAQVSTPEVETDTTVTSKSPSSDGSHLPLQRLPDSTLARYIHRFRHEPPSSRQVRDKDYFVSGKEGEFWWLSPSPPSSSTPKEETPPNRLLPSPPPSLSPKLRRSSARRGGASSRTSSTSPIPKARSLSSPSKSSLEGLDTKTAELQRRAKSLLEKSESTLETSSSEPYRPVKKVPRRPPEERTLRDEPSQHPSITAHGTREHPMRPYQSRPAPPPEEDILYQWRLARKMEKAQEQASKWGPAGGLFPSRSRPQGSPLDRTQRDPLSSGFLQATSQLEPPVLSSITSTTQPTPTSLAVSLGPPRDPGHKRPEFPFTSTVPAESGGMASLSTETKTTPTVPLVLTCDREVFHPQVTSYHPGISSSAEPLPSDQLHQTVATEISRDNHAASSKPHPISTTDVSNTIPTSTLAEGRTPLELSSEQFRSADVPSHMHLSCDILPCPHQKALLERGEAEQTVTIPLSLPVVEVMQEEMHGEERERATVYRAHRPTNESREHKRVRETGGLVSAPERLRTGLFGSQKSPASVTKSRMQRHQRKESENRTTQAQRGTSEREPATDVLRGVIGEVISERLFSTPQSSTSHSSQQSLLESSREEVMPNFAHASEEENINPHSSDNAFSEDEVLTMLQQRAKSYREQLRQIDSILNQEMT